MAPLITARAAVPLNVRLVPGPWAGVDEMLPDSARDNEVSLSSTGYSRKREHTSIQDEL